MRRKPTGKVQMLRNKEIDAKRLLYVRRNVAEWVARIAIPKPARRNRVGRVARLTLQGVPCGERSRSDERRR
jgi:hypothetical protein